MNTTLISNIKATRKAIVCNIGFIITLKGILCIEILKGIFYMFKEAIYHRPKDNYAYAYDEQTIHIRVRTKRDDIQSADLIYGDPYEWKDGKWISASTPMKKRVLLHYLIIGPFQSNQNLNAYVMGLN